MPVRALVLHAYSARNDGDGFLVAATVRLLAAAGIQPSEIAVAAADPSSFGALRTIPLPFSRKRTLANMARATIETAAGAALHCVGLRVGSLAAAAKAADVIVGVGGGYLRAGSRGERLRTGLIHYPQLAVAAESGSKVIYLPQSIGPLRTALGAVIRTELSRLGTVCVRDDRSVAELDGLRNLRRVPDMAALELGRLAPSGCGQPVGVVLIARDLPSRRRQYLPRLQRLAQLIPGATIAIQSEVGGNDDRAFSNHVFPDRPLITARKALAGPPAVVISVRLHGALMAMLAGHPAIHLSYERKGWGAYADLGLEEYVHNAADFDPQVVAAQVEQVMNEPAAFWTRIASRKSVLQREYSNLVSSIHRMSEGKRECA